MTDWHQDEMREAYDPEDPKHPDWEDAQADEADRQRKMAKEDQMEIAEQEQLNEALAKAQGEFPPIPREKTVTVKTKTGGSYSFAYAPLDAILSACRPVLAKNGLAITQLARAEQWQARAAHRAQAQGRRCHRSQLPATPTPRLAAGARVAAHLPAPLRNRRLARDRNRGGRRRRPDDRGQGAHDVPGTSGHRDRALTGAQRKKIHALLAKLKKAGVQGFDDEAVSRAFDITYRVKTVTELSQRQASSLIDRLEGSSRNRSSSD